MPRHIFVRLGVWSDVVDWNKRSAEAALRQSPEEYRSLHHGHALEYAIHADQQARYALVSGLNSIPQGGQ